MITQKDIARKLGLSQMTVSRVLSDSSLVGERTKARVLREVRKLGYRPNITARNLASRRQATIGVLVPGGLAMLSPYFLPAFRGISEVAAAAHLGTLLLTAGDWNDCRRKLEEGAHKTDGFVVFNFWEVRPFADKIVRQLRGAGRQAVLIQSSPGRYGAPYFTVDNEEGGRQAAAHLIELGHRRLGCIGLGYRSPETQGRLTGFRARCTEAGIDVPERWIDAGSAADTPSAEPFFSRQGAGLPSAIFALSDRVARAVVFECARRGLVVPADMSVVGFNDDLFATMMAPRLTTVRQPLEQLGREAAKRLLSAVEGKDRGRGDLVLEPELVVGESTGRCG